MNKLVERTQKQINKDRRRFLDMLGKAGISTSILKASTIAGGLMGARFAEAQAGAKKLVMIYHPNGSPNGNWAPRDGSPACSPLQPHASTIAFREMTIGKPGNHGNLHQCVGAGSYNGNDPDGSAFHLQVAKVVGNMTPYSSLELGVDTKGTQGGINFLNGSSIPLEDDPSAAFNRIFNNTPPPTSGGGGGDSGPSIYDRRLKVVDANKAALDALQNKLGMDERNKVDAHLEALEQLERRIASAQTMAEGDAGGGDTGGGGGGGGSCSAPNLTQGNSPLNTYKAQGDIAAAALKCGLTNVVSIQFNETQASWVGADGTPDAVDWAADHHQANHANGAAQLPYLIQYMNKGVAHLISRLKAEGIYNDTVVVVVSEMGDGQDHSAGDGPIIVASGISGLRAGDSKDGADHYGIFADVTNLLGLGGSVGGMIADYGRGGHVA